MSRLVPSLITMRRYGGVTEFELFLDFTMEILTIICFIIAGWDNLNKIGPLVYPIGWFVGTV